MVIFLYVLFCILIMDIMVQAVLIFIRIQVIFLVLFFILKVENKFATECME